jgi:hypothetical protein
MQQTKQQLEQRVFDLLGENSRLEQKLEQQKIKTSKARNWAKTRNNQVAQLINTLENNSKSQINSAGNVISSALNNLLTPKK